MEDSLKVSFDDESGQITLEWDPEDSRWNWLNDLTSDEVTAIITQYLETRLDELDELDDKNSESLT